MINPKSIQEVIEKAAVEEVVQDYVNLKRAGVNMKGLCPFHDEKTPSFVVSPAKGIYKCFGCGKGGNAVQFVMDHENLSFPDAIRHLARRFNIALEETEASEEVKAERQLQESLHLVNNYAMEYFQKQLLETDRGKSVGLSYFKERGFLESTIEKFNLGYAPAGWDIFTKAAVQANYNIDFLKKLGLTTQKDKDFFRDRVIFPIHGLSGKVLAFAGRILQKDARGPKYLNSPETEIYHKSNILYGIYFAKQAVRKLDECMLVEGYTDVLSLHQAGIENVVASSGTSLTTGQVQLIKRFTPNLKIIYDGDKAGINAALRGLDVALKQDLNVRVVILPEGEDPDSYIKKVGKSAFQEYAQKEAKDFIFLKIDLLLGEAGNDPIKKSQVIRTIIESIAIIPDPIKRGLYLKEASRILEVSEQVLVDETNKLVTQAIKKEKNQQAREAPEEEEKQTVVSKEEQVGREMEVSKDLKINDLHEKEIARILVLFGGKIYDEEEQLSVAAYILGNIEEVLDDFNNVSYGRIARICLKRLLDKEPLDRTLFTQHSDPKIREIAIDLLQSPFEYSPNWEAKWDIILQTQVMPEENFFLDSRRVLLEFKLRKFTEMCEDNKQYILDLQKARKDEELMIYLKVHQELTTRRNDLAKELNRVIIR